MSSQARDSFDVVNQTTHGAHHEREAQGLQREEQTVIKDVENITRESLHTFNCHR